MSFSKENCNDTTAPSGCAPPFRQTQSMVNHTPGSEHCVQVHCCACSVYDWTYRELTNNDWSRASTPETKQTIWAWRPSASRARCHPRFVLEAASHRRHTDLGSGRPDDRRYRAVQQASLASSWSASCVLLCLAYVPASETRTRCPPYSWCLPLYHMLR
jgi:hypothetical protein